MEEKKTPLQTIYIGKGIDFKNINRVPSKSIPVVWSNHDDAGISFSKGISFCYFSIIATILALRCKMSFINLQVAYNPEQPNPRLFKSEWCPKQVDGIQRWSWTICHPFINIANICEMVKRKGMSLIWVETKGSSLNMRPADVSAHQVKGQTCLLEHKCRKETRSAGFKMCISMSCCPT